MSVAALLADGRAWDREQVYRLCAPYLRIERTSAALITLPAWSAVRTEGKVLLYLLSRRVLWALDVIEDALATPAEIACGANLPGGSVRPALQRLVRARVVARKGGLYTVHLNALDLIAAYLPGEEG